MGEVVGEGGVGFAEGGEVGVGFGGVADVEDEEEGGGDCRRGGSGRRFRPGIWRGCL